MAYSAETHSIAQRLRGSLQFIGDTHTRQMTAAWVRAWDDVAPELLALLAEIGSAETPPTRTQLLKSKRLANALLVIEARLIELFDQSAQAAIGSLHLVVDQAGRGADALVSSMLPPGESVDGWTRVDPAQVNAIVERTSQRITRQSKPLSAKATATMKRELINGVLTGSNPRVTARRILSRTESTFNGGLSRALVIARTETLDASRAAGRLADKANRDVLQCWIWVSALSSRTCPSCFAMHGTEHPIDEPGPEDHQCGRCVRVPKTKSWAELGFNIPEPPSILANGAERFASLTRNEQIDILGPARFAAWQAGKFPMSVWAQKKSADGWRDSWQARPAPADFKGTRRSEVATAAGGSGGSGAKHPPTTFGDNFGPEPDPADTTAMATYWLHRQNALPVDFKGDRLEPHEVRFVERFLNAGHGLDWIPRTRVGPTNDFRWTTNGNIFVELKSTKARAETIHSRILDAVIKASRQRVVKENFIIDIGDALLTPAIADEIGAFNVGRRKYRISRLWVMSRGDLHEISLRAD